MSEILVDYFSTIADGIGGEIAKLKSLKDFKDHPRVLRKQQQSVNWSRNLEVTPITQGQVLAALEPLNTNKATGYDNIPAKVLKIAANQLAKPLTTLFNSHIRNCFWPRDWKHGIWTPVYKKDNKHSKENYRPITVLPCVDKVFEQLIGAQVSTGFEDCTYVNSSAYCRGHSCETTLIHLVEGWRHARDEKLDVSCCQLTCQKRFIHSIHHDY